MREFGISDSTKDMEFKVTGEQFIAKAPSKVPANIVTRYTEMVNRGMLHQAHVMFFNAVLPQESEERFMIRLDSVENPITLSQMANVANWLMEIYSGNGTAKQ